MMRIQIQHYRENGAKGALLDEYERSINHLKAVISDLQPAELTAIVDMETTDRDCRSIQSVLTHVVRSGFGYAIYIRKQYGEAIDFHPGKTCDAAAGYITELDAAFSFMEETFRNHPNIQLESLETEQKMLVRWGQMFDVEQLMEHAIVHILRHRRQIERFLLKLNHQG